MISKRTIVAAAIMAALATFIVILFQNNSRMNDEIQRLHSQLLDLEKLRAENARLAKTQITTNEPGLAPDQMSELLRLRGQVGSLKRQLAESAGKPRTPAPQPGKPIDPEWENLMAKQQYIAKMNLTRLWLLAFRMYADEHQDQFPASYAQAIKYLDEDHKNDAVTATNHFEMVFQGPTSGLGDLSKVIVLRETQATQGDDGGWFKAYGFADGHSEVHGEATGNFGPWESARMPKPSGQ